MVRVGLETGVVSAVFGPNREVATAEQGRRLMVVRGLASLCLGAAMHQWGADIRLRGDAGEPESEQLVEDGSPVLQSLLQCLGV